MKNKIVLVGCGKIGMIYAYSLITQNINVDQIVCIDLDAERAQSDINDLRYCLTYNTSKIKISGGTYEDCKDAKMVVIAAGAHQSIGDSTMDLIYKNSLIFKQIIGDVMAHNFEGIFLIATYPSDVLTTYTLKLSGVDPSRVIGIGTSFNNTQLKYLLKNRLDVAIDNIDAYVIGENGDYQFIPWSIATCGLYNITESLSYDVLLKIENEIKKYSYDVIHNNQFSAFLLGLTLVQITDSILNDKKNIMCVSNYDKENDICISMPAKIGYDGILEKRWVKLNEEEQLKLIDSIDSIKYSLSNILNND